MWWSFLLCVITIGTYKKALITKYLGIQPIYYFKNFQFYTAVYNKLVVVHQKTFFFFLILTYTEIRHKNNFDFTTPALTHGRESRTSFYLANTNIETSQCVYPNVKEAE